MSALIIKRAEFFISVGADSALPVGNKREIAVCGKSNVGKSSLINCITNRRGLAKTSGTPGKTRLINYFDINDAFYLVDLPGYGYAKAPKSEQQRWGELMQRYFEQSEGLCFFVLLMDIRHDPTALDTQMLNYVLHYGFPFCIAATKADKIAKSKRFGAAEKLRKTLRLKEMAIPAEVIPFSSSDGAGKDALLRVMGAALEER